MTHLMRAKAFGALLSAVVIASTVVAADDAEQFQNENNAAMARMMAAMHAAPSGSVDRDFLTMMIPHHQGAIDMARAQLRHGRDERLKRLAQEIIITQQQEIAVMRAALDERMNSNPEVGL